MTESMFDRFDQLVKMKLNIGSMDLKIAACGLDLNATVVTQNVRDFRRVPGLLWEDWTQ
jgi:tRNA(fMet)-specific endonuclease VapC